MSIPYNTHLQWATYQSTPDWHKQVKNAPPKHSESAAKRAASEIFTLIFKESIVRSIQCLRDSARLVLKVPVRSIWTPIILPKNWRERERAAINVKLTGCSLVQLLSLSAKSLMALTALALSIISENKAHACLDKSQNCTQNMDGNASRLEALKEQGAKRAPSQIEYNEYKKWLYAIDARLCRL